MDCNKIVHVRADYLLERIDGEITVYHPTLATSLYLNDTGALIWELCDGQRSIAAIIDLLAELYPESSEQIARDVKQLVNQLVSHDIAILK